MELQTIRAFRDELVKLSLAGGVTQAPSAPKTSAATPAPSARVAPTSVPKAPVLGTPGLAHSAIPKAAPFKNPSLQAQVSNMRRYTNIRTPAPPRRMGSIKPKPTPVPNIRGVATLPVRPTAPQPAFQPKVNSNFMSKYTKPQSAADLGI